MGDPRLRRQQRKLATDLGADVLLVTTNDFDTAEKAIARVKPDCWIVLCGLDFSKPFSIPSDD